MRQNLPAVVVASLLIIPMVLAGGWFVANHTLVAYDTAHDQEQLKSQGIIELVVIDAPHGFEAKAHILGFVIGPKTVLQELDITALKVRVPIGMSSHEATSILVAAYPSLIVEKNTEHGAYNISAGIFKN